MKFIVGAEIDRRLMELGIRLINKKLTDHLQLQLHPPCTKGPATRLWETIVERPRAYKIFCGNLPGRIERLWIGAHLLPDFFHKGIHLPAGRRGSQSPLFPYYTCMKDGYLHISKQWGKEELLELDFPMDVRILQAAPRVREDIGKVAVTRGPLVYCLEEVDNDKNLHLLTLDWDTPASTEPFTINDEQVTAILMQGHRQSMPDRTGALYQPLSKPSMQDCLLRFIPYYTWGNRGENEMTVWIRALNR